MKKKVIIKFSTLLLIITILQNIILVNNIFAANGTFHISLSKSTANQGERVTLTISAQNAYGQLNITATNATIEGGSSVFLQNDSKQVTIIPNSAGKNVNITVKPSSAGLGDSGENPINDVRTAVITVNGQSGSSGNPGNSGNEGNSGNQNNPSDNNTGSKSSNADLSNLGIRPNDFTGFKPNQTEYKVTVPYNVEVVEIYAKPKDSKAKISSGTGKKRLKEGTNKLDVIVTAEDGTKKTYTIYVTRNSEDENITPNVTEEPPEEEKPEKLSLTAIALQNDLNLSLNPVFNSQIYEYTVEVENDIQSLELSGIPNVDGAQVLIEGNENLLEGENIVTLTVKSEGYEDIVYKITVIRKEKVEEVINQEESKEIQQVDLNNSMATTKIIIIISVIVFIIIAIIVILILRKRKSDRRLNVSYDDYYNDYMNEENSGELKNNSELESESEEISEGYTVEIGEDETYKEKPKKRKGKHF